LIFLFLPFTVFSQLSYTNDIDSHYFYENLDSLLDTVPVIRYDGITLNSIIREEVPIIDTVFADYVIYLNKRGKIKYKENPQVERTKIYTKSSNFLYEYKETLLFIKNKRILFLYYKQGTNNGTTYH